MHGMFTLKLKGPELEPGPSGPQHYAHLLFSSLMAPKVAMYQNQLWGLLKIQIFWHNSDTANLTFWSSILFSFSFFSFLLLCLPLCTSFLSDLTQPAGTHLLKAFGKHFSVQWFWNLCAHQKYLEALLKYRLNLQSFWFSMSEMENVHF